MWKPCVARFLLRKYQTRERVNEWIEIRRSKPERAEVSGCDESDSGRVWRSWCLAFEEAFQERMKEWCLDGKPRSGRGYRTYVNCPLPTPEDRLLFILVYLKTHLLQIVQRRLFGMPQNKASQWIHRSCPSCKPPSSPCRRASPLPGDLTQRLATA